MSMWIVASAALAGILSFLLIKPLFEPALSLQVELKGGGCHRALLDRKERALRSLKDLELDHSMGKVGDEEFRAARESLAMEVGKLLEEIKRHGGS